MKQQQGAHRQCSTYRLMSHQKRAKAFNLQMPQALHLLIKSHAKDSAQKNGGQPNMNREMVQKLFDAYKEELDEEQQAECLEFIGTL